MSELSDGMEKKRGILREAFIEWITEESSRATTLIVGMCTRPITKKTTITLSQVTIEALSQLSYERGFQDAIKLVDDVVSTRTEKIPEVSDVLEKMSRQEGS